MKNLSYILDTNICIYLIKHSSNNVLKKFSNISAGAIGISSITMAELIYGAYKSQHQEKNLRAIENFLIPLEVLPFDDNAAIIYGELRSLLEKKGRPIGPLDLMIAAHSKSLAITLVTNNTREFSRVPELTIENWAS